jgi:hypothetical protein
MKSVIQVRGSVRLSCWFVFFPLISGCLLLGTQPAMADQCSLPTVGVGTGAVGSATGPDTCGAIIIVSAVDPITHAATSFTVFAAGNGNPYDGIDDTLIGVQNSSGGQLNSILLSGSDIFGFEEDGPCTLHAYSWCGTGTGYEGPANTFNITDSSHGTVVFTNGIPNYGSTWFALEGTPQSISGNTQTSTLFETTTTLTFNADTVQTLDYSNTGLLFTGITVQDTFFPISGSAYQNLVAGTFAQGSKCMPQDISGNGTQFACAGTIVLCSTATAPNDFAGQNCPHENATGLIGVSEKYLTNAFPEDPTTVPSPGYLMATDNALGCTNDTTGTCRNLQNIFTPPLGDCCTTSGGTKSFNSLLIPVYCLDNVTSVDEHGVVGFSQPVDNPGPGPSFIVNVIKSTQAVPLKLTVGCGGTPVNNLDLKTSTNSATTHSVVLSAANAPANTCKTGLDDPTPTTTAAGGSGWQILGNGNYQFNWKPSAPVGSCLVFSVNLGDGVQHSAYFQVTK